MKKAIRNLGNSGGMSLVELLIVIAIIGILIQIAVFATQVVMSRTYFSRVKADMENISQVAYNDFSTSNAWAPSPFTIGALPPSFAANGLSDWPTTPCPGYFYTWDNWLATSVNAVRITLRRPDDTALWSYCIDTEGNNCLAADPLGGVPADISTVDTNYFNCTE